MSLPLRAFASTTGTYLRYLDALQKGKMGSILKYNCRREWGDTYLDLFEAKFEPQKLGVGDGH